MSELEPVGHKLHFSQLNSTAAAAGNQHEPEKCEEVEDSDNNEIEDASAAGIAAYAANRITSASLTVIPLLLMYTLSRMTFLIKMLMKVEVLGV